MSRCAYLFVALIVLVGCRRAPAPHPTESTEPPILGRLPQFDLIDAHGHRVDRTTLAGKVWVANFIFTSCRSTCPRQTATMSRLQARLKGHPHWNDIALVTFTVDPHTDTPEVLQEYATATKADPEKWTFLTGQRDAIWALSTDGFKLGVGEAPDDPEMPLFHAIKMVLIDHEGNIRGYFYGLDDSEVPALITAIDAILDD